MSEYRNVEILECRNNVGILVCRNVGILAYRYVEGAKNLSVLAQLRPLSHRAMAGRWVWKSMARLASGHIEQLNYSIFLNCQRHISKKT